MARLDTRIGNIRMETPLIAVSGVYGIDYEKLIESRPYVGAVVTKSVTLTPRIGNVEPRIVETRAGLLNAIGLQNGGIYDFLECEIPKLRLLEVPIIASVAGSNIDEYIRCSQLLAERDEIDAIELNVSCPNVEAGGIEFGCDVEILERLVTGVRNAVGGKTIITKLTPNVTDITAIAQAAINGGTDALSLINTLRGMTIDLNTQKPTLGNRIGGLSGIGIHPVAVYMVYQSYITCCRKANIPIIGIGGVSNYEEAVELILAGATCVGIGTALFRDETVFKDITEGVNNYMKERNVESVGSLIGKSSKHKIVSFSEIATFLNISEGKLQLLISQGLIPGKPSDGGLETNNNEIEKWYIGLNGNQWADLLENGKIEPIYTETKLVAMVPKERITEVLQHWQDNGIAEVIGHSFRSHGVTTYHLKLIGEYENTKQTLQDIKKKQTTIKASEGKGEILKSVLNNISIAYEDKLTLSTHSIFLSFSQEGLLRLATEETLGHLLQRDREIIQLFLADYHERFVHDIYNI